MCGIAGTLSFKDKNSKEIVRKINECQARRGPDDEGIESIQDNIVFGHRRLSILDLTKAGHQPMKFNDLTITYNGEIYNFKEIRKDLISEGYEFNTDTDTEVILKGYDKWGIDVIHKFRGMFSFGLWDDKKQKLFLVRDRFGIKPLYYYKNNDQVIFSSSVQSLKETKAIPNKEENKAWIGFFLLGSVPAPYTTIKDVFSIKPGHYLEIDKNGNAEDKKYYNLLEKFKTKKDVSFDEAAKKTKELLYDSVKYRLISDVPLGVFLSGGLDSSALAAIASELRDDPITTLSIYFDEEDYSEKEYQDLLVEKIKSNHKSIKITKDNFLGNLDDAFDAMDQPTIDGINSYFVSKAAKEEGLKSVLSGLGSDEIFAGYSSFKKVAWLRKIQQLPKFIKFPLKLFKFLDGRLERLSYLYSDSPFYLYLTIRGLFIPEKISNILGIEEKKIENFIDEIAKHYEEVGKLNSIDLLSYFEIRFYMHNQLLKDTDFMAMHNSVEVRVPFLDYKLVEYIVSIPPQLKLQGKYNKSILIETMKGLIPEEIYKRSKMGFTFPFQKWLLKNKNIKRHWSKYWSNKVQDRFNN